MLNPLCVFMLALDHRWQWEEWCDARSIPRDRIPDAKRVAYDGFLLARDASQAVRKWGALLIDLNYGSAIIPDALARGADVGTPAERAGVFPLAWATDPFERALPGTFVKVLVRHRPNFDAAVRDGQLAKLDALQAWCGTAGKPLVVEVLVPREDEPEEAFEATGRPAIVAAYIREAYSRGLTPAFWKIEGTSSREGAAAIDAAIAAHPECRQIILGKGADLPTIDAWFAAAAGSATASGFAIGRSVYWDAAGAFLGGARSAAQASAEIRDNYLHLVDAWQRGRS